MLAKWYLIDDSYSFVLQLYHLKYGSFVVITPRYAAISWRENDDIYFGPKRDPAFGKGSVPSTKWLSEKGKRSNWQRSSH